MITNGLNYRNYAGSIHDENLFVIKNFREKNLADYLGYDCREKHNIKHLLYSESICIKGNRNYIITANPMARALDENSKAITSVKYRLSNASVENGRGILASFNSLDNNGAWILGRNPVLTLNKEEAMLKTDRGKGVAGFKNLIIDVKLCGQSPKIIVDKKAIIVSFSNHGMIKYDLNKGAIIKKSIVNGPGSLRFYKKDDQWQEDNSACVNMTLIDNDFISEQTRALQYSFNFSRSVFFHTAQSNASSISYSKRGSSFAIAKSNDVIAVIERGRYGSIKASCKQESSRFSACARGGKGAKVTIKDGSLYAFSKHAASVTKNYRRFEAIAYSYGFGAILNYDKQTKKFIAEVGDAFESDYNVFYDNKLICKMEYSTLARLSLNEEEFTEMIASYYRDHDNEKELTQDERDEIISKLDPNKEVIGGN